MQLQMGVGDRPPQLTTVSTVADVRPASATTLEQLAKTAQSTCSSTGRQIGVETLLLAAIGSSLTKAKPSRKSWII
jgi:hypothetical protein